ncbi:MAG TPA: hypothetical protein DCM05_01690 [Elusimicrobia bacterium]|nr:hypothetical protein [Elusimicrobiota bacterium]
MSFKGVVRAQCPKGCEESDYEVWSFVRGDQSEDLRLGVLAGDLNLARCAVCGQVFFPDCTLVYYDLRVALIAFVFPEAYRGDEVRWRAKMKEDYEQMRASLGKELQLLGEPLVCFGLSELSAVLRSDDDLEDEVLVARYAAEALGYRMRPVQRDFARARGLPRMLPSKEWKEGAPFDLPALLKALRALLKSNGKLKGYRSWLKELESAKTPPPLPPAGKR